LIKHTQTTTETLYSRTHTQWENGKKTKEKIERVFRDDGKVLGCEIPVTVSKIPLNSDPPTIGFTGNGWNREKDKLGQNNLQHRLHSTFSAFKAPPQHPPFSIMLISN
jgi:hypothetical protein